MVKMMVARPLKDESVQVAPSSLLPLGACARPRRNGAVCHDQGSGECHGADDDDDDDGSGNRNLCDHSPRRRMMMTPTSAV